MSSNKKNVLNLLIISFALFSMFFGAGNVIFPPYLGVISGQDFFKSSLGFIITGAGLPILGILAIAKAKDFDNFANKVFPSFSIILGAAIMLAIGPGLAIPKTAALTHEIGILAILPNAPQWISIIAFFLITLFFSLNPKDVIRKLGSILTPLLLISLIVLIVKGIFVPIGELPDITLINGFGRGFVEGYQTMDALASVMFAVVILKNVKNTLNQDGNALTKSTAITGLLAGLGLGIIYLGMIYIGACASSAITPEMSKSQIVIYIADTILGSWGKIFLALIIGLACLTTAIGLTTTAGEYFENITRGTLKYRPVVIITCVISAFIAYNGVDKIVAYSVPVLLVLYPVVISLILLNVLSFRNDGIYKGVVLPVLVYSILLTFLPKEAIESIVKIYPWFTNDFGWMPIGILGGVIGWIIKRS